MSALVDKYLTCAQALKADRNNRALNDEYHRLISRIAATSTPSFVAAVMAHANTNDPVLVASLASLVFLHGDSNDRKLPLPVDPALKPQLVGILRTWVEVVTAPSPSGARYQLCDVSIRMGHSQCNAGKVDREELTRLVGFGRR